MCCSSTIIRWKILSIESKRLCKQRTVYRYELSVPDNHGWSLTCLGRYPRWTCWSRGSLKSKFVLTQVFLRWTRSSQNCLTRRKARKKMMSSWLNHGQNHRGQLTTIFSSRNESFAVTARLVKIPLEISVTVFYNRWVSALLIRKLELLQLKSFWFCRDNRLSHLKGSVPQCVLRASTDQIV